MCLTSTLERLSTDLCPNCIYQEQYTKDGSFAAFIDFQSDPELFFRQVKGMIDHILSSKFAAGESVRISNRRFKSYIRTALALIGCPDVAEVMERDANEAKRILQVRISDLELWSPVAKQCNASRDKRRTETVMLWKKLFSELQKEVPAAKVQLQSVSMVS